MNIFGGVIFASALLGVMVLGAGQALAIHVGCGDTITTDTTLDGDLVDCPNNGIVIGADDVTLDLNGYTVDGDGAPAVGCDESCDLGVASEGHDGVTIKNGSVQEFDYGAVVGKARHNDLVGISSSGNRLFGIAMYASAHSSVRHSSSNRNIPPEGDGLGLFGSHHVRVLHNSFRHNPGPGIHAFGSNHNLIKGNVITHDAPGLVLEKADRNRVRRNRCMRNPACVVVSPGDGNVVAQNQILKGKDGIAIEKGHRNLVAGNDIVGPRAAGVYLALGAPPIGGHHNLVRGNVVRGSGEDAFLVRGEDHHSRLKHNVAVGAGDDGFDIAGHSTKLTGNTARRNADLGIEAVRGVIDGGGNFARHNGNPLQCTNIACG
jgi:parallel beta-helix repeat protein